MKIINKTKWRTEDLRVFASRVLPEVIDDSAKRKLIQVTFINSRTRGISGYVYKIGGTRAWIRLPSVNRVVNKSRQFTCNVNGEDKTFIPHEDVIDKAALAMVIAHEFAHLAGRPGGRSSEIRMRSGARYGYRGDYETFYSWANEMPLRPQEDNSSKVDPVDKTEREIAKIELAIKRWSSKQKRAETAIKIYRKKLAYRQKKGTDILTSLFSKIFPNSCLGS